LFIIHLGFGLISVVFPFLYLVQQRDSETKFIIMNIQGGPKK